MRRLTSAEAERVRGDAKQIWQGEWNRRILLLVVFYAGVELLLFTVFDTGTWDTPLLFVYLGGVSVMMVISHRNWFRRLETDLEEGEVEQVEDPLRFPHWVETYFIPELRYAVFLGDEKLLLGLDSARLGASEENHCAEVLPSTRIIVSIRRAPQRAVTSE